MVPEKYHNTPVIKRRKKAQEQRVVAGENYVYKVMQNRRLVLFSHLHYNCLE